MLQLFCADLTSTQIAEVTRINRNTINRILQPLRARMLRLAEEESYFEAGETEVDESYFWGQKSSRIRRQDESFRHEEARGQHADSKQLLSRQTCADNKKA